MNRYITHFLLVFWLLTTPLCASAGPIAGFEARQLNTQNQLPVSAIHSVYRDREGFLWYGTVNGLCRDDGYHLRIFRPPFLQDQDKVIFTMFEDDKKHLWLGADNGLYCLDKRDNSIRPLNPEHWEGNRIIGIVPKDNRNFWIVSNSHIAVVDSLGVPLKEYRQKSDSGFLEIRSMALYQGIPYLSFKGGVAYSLDPESSQWTKLPNMESGSDATWLTPDSKDDGIWLLYENGSIWHYSRSAEGKDVMKKYSSGTEIGHEPYCMQQSKYDENLWVMDTRGVEAYQPTADGILNRVYSSKGNIPSYHMFAQFLCDSLFTFVSAFDCPSLLLREQKEAFRYMPLQSVTERVGFNATVMALAEAGDGWWWFFQERTGLGLYNDETRQCVFWNDKGQDVSYPLNAGRIICNSSKGVWVNKDTSHQVFHLVRQGSRMKVVSMLNLEDNLSATELVTELCEDSKGRLWVGTNQQLLVYEADNLTLLARYPDAGYVSDIKMGAPNHVLVATLKGRLYDFQNEKDKSCFESGESLSALCKAPDGLIWVGTQSGEVWRYDGKTGDFKNFTEACGLNGDRVNQMIADGYGHLWIETNQRILEYNPRNNASHIYATSDEEIPMTRFLPTAVMTDSLGQIYFGGIPGIIQFHPSNSLDREADGVKVHITDIEVMKHSLLFPQHQDGQSASEITLQPEDRDLEIFFSSLDYFDIQHVRYAYRLKGVDKDWKYSVSGENSALYNQLPKGDFIFEVKATDQNGLWSEDVAQLKIHRLPAFYESTLAYIIYIILGLGVLALLILMVQRRDRKKNEVMWSDSQEMLQMRNYIKGVDPDEEGAQHPSTLPASEYRQLDKLFVERATEAVKQHIHESDFGVEELAMAVNVSKTTLTRKLRAITGKSPLDFIRAQKMQQACLLLQDPDRNILEIAVDLGYSDRKYFTSCFKKEFGQTPTEYRKEKFGNKIPEED